nr:hypothetical protein GCM10025699_24550 [Microbacterium flavescens]
MISCLLGARTRAGQILESVVLVVDVTGLAGLAQRVEVVLVLRLADDLDVEQHHRVVLAAQLGALAGVLPSRVGVNDQ